MRRRLLLLATLAAAAGCGDEARRVTAPTTAAPSAAILDGQNGGNPNFFFLPPLGSDPTGTANYDAGKFSGAWVPIVSVCRQPAPDVPCDGSFSFTFPASAILVQPLNEQYYAGWNTEDPGVTPGYYRVSVSLQLSDPQPTLLGYVDVQLGSSSTPTTPGYVSLEYGRVVPIKFRIELGITGVPNADMFEARITNTGGLFRTYYGDFGLWINPGWLNNETFDAVTMVAYRRYVGDGPCVVTSDPTLAALLQYMPSNEGCFHVTTYPTITNIAAEIVIAMCSELPLGAGQYPIQTMFKYDAPAAILELEDAAPYTPTGTPILTSEACVTPPPSGSLGMLNRGMRIFASGFRRMFMPTEAWAIDLGLGSRTTSGGFSDFVWANPFRIDVASGNGQTGDVGTMLAAPIVARVTGTHAHDATLTSNVPGDAPLAGIPVTFTITSGGGTLGTGTATTLTVNSDANGLASVPWVVGFDPGTNTVVATVPDDPGRFNRQKQVTFTATAVNLVNKNTEIRVLGPSSPGQKSDDVTLKLYDTRPFNAKLYQSGSSTTTTCVWSYGSTTASNYVTIYVPGTDPGAVTLTGRALTGTRAAKVLITCGTAKRTLNVSVVP